VSPAPRRLDGFVLLLFFSASLGACAAVSPRSVVPWPRAPSGAARSLDWPDMAMQRQAEQMPEFIASADRAATRFTEARHPSLGVLGSPGFTSEATGRAGGLIRTVGARHVLQRNWHGVVLVGLIDEQWDPLMDACRQLTARGQMLVGFGTSGQQSAAAAQGVRFDAFIDNGAWEPDGLLCSAHTASGRTAPTQQTANLVALWIWKCEFLAALTRRGHFPKVFLAYTVPGGREWQRGIDDRDAGGRGFRVEPVASGVLGARYLAALRADLAFVRQTQMASIRRVASMAGATGAAGQRCYVYLHGHALWGALGGPHDPLIFTQAQLGWNKISPAVDPEPGDLMFCVGFDQPFNGPFFEGLDEKLRSLGVQMAWSIGVNHPLYDYQLPTSEPVIDQGWAFGDAAVAMPGYPIRVGPTSGVLAHTVLWLVHAEILHPAPASASASAGPRSRDD